MATVEFQRARHRGGTVALVTIDLDQFKALNDQHGHDHGDRALREAAHWMQASFRARDIVARLGGDEFVVLLTDVTLDGAMAALSRLRDAPLRSSFSAGVAIWDGEEDLDDADAPLRPGAVRGQVPGRPPDAGRGAAAGSAAPGRRPGFVVVVA